MPLSRGIFITFEGLDGCGKTTQIERLAATLIARGFDVLATREPGGSAIGERIRAILLDSRTAGLSPSAELALMFADRAQHVDEVILPALRARRVVLCDRYTDSTEAYQGSGRELGSQIVLELHRELCHDLWPNLTLLLDSTWTPASLAPAIAIKTPLRTKNASKMKAPRSFVEFSAVLRRSRNAILTG